MLLAPLIHARGGMLWTPVPSRLRQDSCQIQCDAAVVHRVRVRLCDLCPLLSLHKMATDPISAFETQPHQQNPHLSSLLTTDPKLAQNGD